MASGYLASWFDPGLELPDGLSPERIVAEEVERIGTALATVIYASAIPRRIGGDATDEELAAERVRCRRVAHSLSQALRSWDKNAQLPMGNEVKVQAAQLEWTQFGNEHLVLLSSRLRMTVTWAYRERREQWGRRAAVRYLNEQKWINHALRN